MPGGDNEDLPLSLEEFMLHRHESSVDESSEEDTDTSCEEEDFSHNDTSDEENT